MVRFVFGGGGAVWSKVTRGLSCEVEGCSMSYAKHEFFLEKVSKTVQTNAICLVLTVSQNEICS